VYEFLLRTMKGFGYGLLIGPVAIAFIAAVQAVRHNQAIADTLEARATIRNAHVFTPRTNETPVPRRFAHYKLDLDWRDDQGRERRADSVAIHPQLGRRLVEGNALVQDTVRIRYRAGEPDRVLMVEPRVDDIAPRNPLIEALAAAHFSWPLALFGGMMFYFALKRERGRTQ
jgi:hypothetical protein